MANTIGAKLLYLPREVGGNPLTKDSVSLSDIQQIVSTLNRRELLTTDYPDNT